MSARFVGSIRLPLLRAFQFMRLRFGNNLESLLSTYAFVANHDSARFALQASADSPNQQAGPLGLAVCVVLRQIAIGHQGCVKEIDTFHCGGSSGAVLSITCSPLPTSPTPSFVRVSSFVSLLRWSLSAQSSRTQFRWKWRRRAWNSLPAIRALPCS